MSAGSLADQLLQKLQSKLKRTRVTGELESQLK